MNSWVFQKKKPPPKKGREKLRTKKKDKIILKKMTTRKDVSRCSHLFRLSKGTMMKPSLGVVSKKIRGGRRTWGSIACERHEDNSPGKLLNAFYIHKGGKGW